MQTALEPACPAISSLSARQSGLHSIVIVGGGFAGAALAYHLLQRRRPQLQVTIIEQRGKVGGGVAYGGDNPLLRLNVPASRMSLDPNQPADFVSFAGAHDDPHAFLPRPLYGSYVVDRLGQARRDNPGQLYVIEGAAVAIEPQGVRLADGRLIVGGRVVLATGVEPRGRVCTVPLPDDDRVVDGWDEAAVARLPRAGRILVLGSGLSALDVLGVLDGGQHRAGVVVLSRHGLLPRAHTPQLGPSPLPLELGQAPAELGALLRWARAVVRAAVRAGSPWQHGLDALRPHIPAIWQRLSARDRRRFVRRVRPYWEVLRHRAPADALERIAARRARGELSVLAGRITACHARPAGLEVRTQLRDGSYRLQRFDRIVRCIGPGLGVEPESSPLLASLLRDGEAHLDECRIGIVTAQHGRLVAGSGQASERVFALGQLCKASRWETTAVPEIVRDAVALSELLTREA